MITAESHPRGGIEALPERKPCHQEPTAATTSHQLKSYQSQWRAERLRGIAVVPRALAGDASLQYSFDRAANEVVRAGSVGE